MEQRPANGRPSGPHGLSGNRPRGSAHARREMHVACQIRKAHESGNERTNREEVPGRWSDSLQLRPGGWSDSPRGVERIAPLGSLPTASKWNRARIGNSAHESGIARTNRERTSGAAVHDGDSAAASGRRTPGDGALVAGPDNPGAENRSRPRYRSKGGSAQVGYLSLPA